MDTQIEVAVKIRNLHRKKSGQDENKVLKSSLKEVALWNVVGTHANCVQLLESFFDDHLAYMLMEKCDASLFIYLQRRRVVDEKCLGGVFAQMLTGVSHMHSASVIHRDLKPTNFLVRGDIVKVCDFGLSVMMPSSGIVEGMVGTASFMAPEILAAQNYDQKVDIWAFGVVAYLLLCGTCPYESCDGSPRKMKMAIVYGDEADCGRSWLTAGIVRFLQEVLQRSPEKRPTATRALELLCISRLDTKHLPSLHRILKNAAQSGAFDSRSLLSVTATDVVLRRIRDASSTHLPKDTKGKIPNEMDEVPNGTLSQRSESTAYESSPYPSAGSKLSS